MGKPVARYSSIAQRYHALGMSQRDDETTTDRARLRALVERNGLLAILTELVALCRELPSPLHSAAADRLVIILNHRPPLRSLRHKEINGYERDPRAAPPPDGDPSPRPAPPDQPDRADAAPEG